MDEKNRELLGKVINNRLEQALSKSGEAAEESKLAFKEAMDAVSKQIELDKIEAAHAEHEEKMNMERVKLNNEESKTIREESFKAEEAKRDRWVQIGLFAAGLFASPLIEVACKKSYAKLLCEFEKDYTFTTSAGRSLSGLFKFKK